MSDLRAVALAYETAVTQGDPPRKFVQKVFGISASAAAKRIQMARRAGWIDPAAGQGRSPRRNKKLLAIGDVCVRKPVLAWRESPGVRGGPLTCPRWSQASGG